MADRLPEDEAGASARPLVTLAGDIVPSEELEGHQRG